jgi:hypothetical protein
MLVMAGLLYLSFSPVHIRGMHLDNCTEAVMYGWPWPCSGNLLKKGSLEKANGDFDALVLGPAIGYPVALCWDIVVNLVVCLATWFVVEWFLRMRASAGTGERAADAVDVTR